VENARRKLKQARTANDLTIAEASELAGVDERKWHYFEWNGKHVPRHFGDMCRVVGLDPIELLKEEGYI
jgi:hypothetical protein